MKNLLSGLLSLLLICACAHDAKVETVHSLLPVPQEMQMSDGGFTLRKGTKLYTNVAVEEKNAITNAFAEWNELLEPTAEECETNCIAMEICGSVENISSPEGYSIDVTEDKISIRATSAAGLFYAA